MPFNWIREGEILASVYPEDLDYLRFLIDEGIRSVINLEGRPWPAEWMDELEIEYLHLPVVDMSIPSPDQVERGIDFIRKNVQRGGIMIHCIAGLGRTGTLIALFLVNEGMKPDEAMEEVRSKRPGSIQSGSQVNIIYQYYEQLERDKDLALNLKKEKTTG